MKLPLQALDHLVLRVRDLPRVLAFYVDVLGCRVERRLDIGLVQLRAGSALIDLVPLDSELGRGGGAAPDPAAPNLDHFCLRLQPFDEAAIRAHLAAHGIDAGPTAQRYGAQGEGPSIYLSDPEGNRIELKGPPSLPAPAWADRLQVVVSTVGSAEDADRLAAALVAQGLAACVQVTAIRSHYRWQGRVQADAEWRLEAKTTAAQCDALLQALRAQHPYSLPQIVVHEPVPAADPAAAAYADWVRAQVGPAQTPR